MNLKKFIFLTFFIVTGSIALSQVKNCTSSLQEAQKLFNEGRIDEIDKLLTPCIEKGFTRTQRIDAYKLIILASLLDGNQARAESTMTELLKKNPEYEIESDDPVEFVYLFESYKTTSVFSIGVEAGPAFYVPLIKERWTSGDINTTSSTYKTSPGFQAGISANRYIAKRLFVNMEVFYSSNSYTFIDKYLKYGNFDNEKDYEIISLKEQINRIDIPLTFGLELGSRATTFYFRAGASYSYVFNVTGSPSKEIVYNSEIINGSEKNIINSRIPHLFFAQAGFGIKHKVSHGFLSLDIRYNYGINQFVNTNKRIQNDFISDFRYIDDDFSINGISLSLGYFYSFYQPKKTNR